MPVYEHPRPAVTVDVVLHSLGDEARLHLLLVRRGKAPFRGRWALPGGFIGMEEDLEAAARRELFEETGMEAGKLVQIGAFGRPDRDPRGRVISIAFSGRVRDPEATPEGGSDASEARWFPVDDLPRLAFDHDEIIAAAFERLQS